MVQSDIDAVAEDRGYNREIVGLRVFQLSWPDGAQVTNAQAMKVDEFQFVKAPNQISNLMGMPSGISRKESLAKIA